MEREERLDIRSAASRQQSVLARLARLADAPPQSLVLEGGTRPEREAVARWWAALLNCRGSERPCLECTPCRQIADNSFKDLLLLDEAHYEEGKSRLSVGAVRAVRPAWGQPPDGPGFRVTIFPYENDLSTEVSNTLLKSLEEPRPGNVFVLLAPQRERLLPTLVSRSWVFTLAWPEMEAGDPEAAALAREMVALWKSGRGWFDQTQSKIPAPLALGVVNHLLAGLRDARTGQGDGLGGELAALLDAKGLRRLDLALERAQEALSLSPSPVNPSLVLDWVAASVRR